MGRPSGARAAGDRAGRDSGRDGQGPEPGEDPGEHVAARRRDKDLCSRRFLATHRWPAITFEADYIQPEETGWTVGGTLTVKDAHCALRLDVERPAISAEADHVNRHVTGRMDRRSAALTTGPAFLIGHMISLSLSVRLPRQPRRLT